MKDYILNYILDYFSLFSGGGRYDYTTREFRDDQHISLLGLILGLLVSPLLVPFLIMVEIVKFVFKTLDGIKLN